MELPALVAAALKSDVKRVRAAGERARRALVDCQRIANEEWDRAEARERVAELEQQLAAARRAARPRTYTQQRRPAKRQCPSCKRLFDPRGLTTHAPACEQGR